MGIKGINVHIHTLQNLACHTNANYYLLLKFNRKIISRNFSMTLFMHEKFQICHM